MDGYIYMPILQFTCKVIVFNSVVTINKNINRLTKCCNICNKIFYKIHYNQYYNIKTRHKKHMYPNDIKDTISKLYMKLSAVKNQFNIYRSIICQWNIDEYYNNILTEIEFVWENINDIEIKISDIINDFSILLTRMEKIYI